MRGEFFDVDGVRLYGYAAGQRGRGVPIVLVHGFPTSSHLWAEVVPLLPEGHRVLVLDLLGYGRSDRPGTHPLSLRAHAERVLAVLDQLRVERACLVGHEMGAAVAQLLATRWPTRVSHLALVSAAVADAWPVRELKLARATLPLTRHLPPNWLLTLLRRDLARGYTVHEHGLHSVEMYFRPFTGADGRDALMAHLAQMDAAELAALGARTRELAMPAAVVWGAEDPFLPLALGRTLHDGLRGATLHVVPDGRHFLPEESPQHVAAAVADLLTR
jgi:pimeloyl-ACP methyl ester carboxylesterase